MTSFILSAAAKEQESGFIFRLDAQLLFDAAILAFNIFLLFILLSYILYNPARNMLKKRQEMITATREETAAANKEAKALKDEYDAKLKDAERDAEAILAEARKKAIKNEEKIISEAKLEAAAIVEQARKEANLEKEKASDDVKKEIIKVATLMASKMVSASISEAEQSQLIDETLREMGENTWLN